MFLKQSAKWFKVVQQNNEHARGTYGQVMEIARKAQELAKLIANTTDEAKRNTQFLWNSD